MQTSPVLAHIDADLPNAISRLQDLLRIRSISTDPAFKADCLHAAEWLARDLGSFGITASVRPTPGHPMVVGHVAGPRARRMCCFTAITMCSRWIRWICGKATRSIPPSPKAPMAPPFRRAAHPTTRAS